MEFKNNIRLEIVKQGYNSISSFCEQNDLSYQKIYRLVKQKNGGFHIGTIIEVCEALNCDVGDLFYIEKESS